MNKFLVIIGAINVLLFLCVGCNLSPTQPSLMNYDFEGREPTPIEQEMLDAINAERKAHGLYELEWCNGLGALALAHSKDEYDRQYFCHNNPEGEGPTDRARAGHAGAYKFEPIVPPYSWIGENIARGFPDVKSAMDSLMNGSHCAGHRANILSDGYTHIGIGYFYVAEQCSINHVWTQNFATRNPDVIVITR